jgi:hypothetical protein
MLAAVVLLTFAPLFAFVHPFGNARVQRPDGELMVTAHVDPSVRDVLERACQNCHSERTTWPWYSHFAPMSWLIERDVQGARGRWNMSKWNEYGLEEQEEILSQIGPMIRNKKMPLPQYTFLHPEAKLSDADVALLYQWSRSERKRLKAVEQVGTDH